MTKEQILKEVANSNWQPTFKFTDDLDAVVDSILQPHEDYFLGLHGKVKEIIEREIKNRTDTSILQIVIPEAVNSITFADVCNWQKELFEYKKYQMREWTDRANCIEQANLKPYEISDREVLIKCINNLPNQYINLGLRSTNVIVGNFIPPHPMFLVDLKEMCFPIIIENSSYKRNSIDIYSQLYMGNEFVWFQGDYVDTNDFENPIIDEINLESSLLNELTNWYKLFNQIHFFEDLNGRIGGIVINILSYILTNKYLINEQNV